MELDFCMKSARVTTPLRNVRRRNSGPLWAGRGSPEHRPEPGARERGENCDEDRREPELTTRRRLFRGRASGHLREMLPDAPDLPGEVARGLVPVPGRLGVAALDDPAERRRDSGPQSRDRFGIVVEHGRERVDARVLLECAPARGHLVEDGSERELVRPEIDGLPSRLLRRHVAGGADDVSGERRRGRFRGGLCPLARVALKGAGEAEIHDLDEPFPRDHDVGRLQVAVHDSGVVGRGEPVGDLAREIEELARGQGPLRDQLAQGLAFHELHRHPGHGLRYADVVDGDDVGIVERGRGFGFALEPRQVRGVGSELRREHLDRHAPIEPRVARRVDFPHSACADWRQDFVGPEPSTRCESHAATPEYYPRAARRPFRTTRRQARSDTRPTRRLAGLAGSSIAVRLLVMRPHRP